MDVSCGPSPNASRMQTPAAKIPAATRPIREEGSFERDKNLSKDLTRRVNLFPKQNPV